MDRTEELFLSHDYLGTRVLRRPAPARETYVRQARAEARRAVAAYRDVMAGCFRGRMSAEDEWNWQARTLLRVRECWAEYRRVQAWARGR